MNEQCETNTHLVRTIDEKRVDVAINVLGKTAQTLLSLLSLLKHCHRHIDRIYFIHERSPINQNYSHGLTRKILGDKLVWHTPKYHLWRYAIDMKRMGDPDYRWSQRYQYAWEHTDKDYLLLIHNDVLFTADAVELLLESIEGHIAVGDIGMCQHCPPYMAGECDPTRYLEYRPDFEHLHELSHLRPEELEARNILPERYRYRRQYCEGDTRILQKNPWPLPDCRVNEYCCLIDMKTARPLTMPHGNTVPFGAYLDIGDPETGYGVLDIGAGWFRSVHRKGHVCRHVDLGRHVQHRVVGMGHQALFKEEMYIQQEERALKLLEGKFRSMMRDVTPYL